jgi:hypothetical protein
MQQTTKRTLGIAVVSALIIGVATTVIARPGYGPGWGGHHGMMGGPGGMHGMRGGPGWMMSDNPTANVEQRLTDLKGTLGITIDQETAWNAYVQAVEGKAGLMQAHRQSMLNSGPPTPEQRLAFHQQGFNQMQQVQNARQDLLQVLTPEQQARAGNLIGLNCRR